MLKNKKTIIGVLLLTVVVALGVYGLLPDRSDCNAEEGSVVRIWAPSYMEMGLFVENALAPVVEERCGYVTEFRESEIDYREAARDIAAVLAEDPAIDLLMLDEGMARDLAADGVIPEPSAVLFSIEEETGLDFFGIALVRPRHETPTPDGSEASEPAATAPFKWTAQVAHAQEPEYTSDPDPGMTPEDYAGLGVDKLSGFGTGISAVDDVMKFAKGDVSGLVMKKGQDYLVKREATKAGIRAAEKELVKGVAQHLALDIGEKVAARVALKLNVVTAVGSLVWDIGKLTYESYLLADALSDLDEALARGLRDALDRIGTAAKEAAAMAFALLKCEADPNQAEQRLAKLVGQARRDYDWANRVANEIRTINEKNTQIELNDKIYKYFGAAAEAAESAIAARRAMGDECSLISLRPDPLEFGDVCVRKTEKMSVRARNFHTAFDIHVREVKWPWDTHFKAVDRPVVYALSPGEEKMHDIEYTPQREGEHGSELAVEVKMKVLGTELVENRSVPVTGNGVPCETETEDKYPKLTLAPDPADFGDVCIGVSKTLIVTAANDGDVELRKLFHAGLSGPPFSSPFREVPRLGVGERHEYAVTYTARSGRDEATFNVTARTVDELGEERLFAENVEVRGRGIDCSPPKEEAVAPSPEPEETPAPEPEPEPKPEPGPGGFLVPPIPDSDEIHAEVIFINGQPYYSAFFYASEPHDTCPVTAWYTAEYDKVFGWASPTSSTIVSTFYADEYNIGCGFGAVAENPARIIIIDQEQALAMDRASAKGFIHGCHHTCR